MRTHLFIPLSLTPTPHTLPPRASSHTKIAKSYNLGKNKLFLKMAAQFFEDFRYVAKKSSVKQAFFHSQPIHFFPAAPQTPKLPAEFFHRAYNEKISSTTGRGDSPITYYIA